METLDLPVFKEMGFTNALTPPLTRNEDGLLPSSVMAAHVSFGHHNEDCHRHLHLPYPLVVFSGVFGKLHRFGMVTAFLLSDSMHATLPLFFSVCSLFSTSEFNAIPSRIASDIGDVNSMNETRVE